MLFRSLLKFYFLWSETFHSSYAWSLFQSNDEWHFSPLSMICEPTSSQLVLRLKILVGIIFGLNVSVINNSKPMTKQSWSCKQRAIRMPTDYKLEMFFKKEKYSKLESVLGYFVVVRLFGDSLGGMLPVMQHWENLTLRKLPNPFQVGKPTHFLHEYWSYLSVSWWQWPITLLTKAEN